MLVIANARVFGGGFQIAPDADLRDGLLDAVWFGNMRSGGRLAALARLLRGTHRELRGGQRGPLAVVPPRVRRSAGVRDRRGVEPRARGRAARDHRPVRAARAGALMAGVFAGARSALAVFGLMAWFVLGGVYQRLFVYPAVFLWPRRRTALTSRYFRGMSHGILALIRMGGGRSRATGTVPTAAPVLVLMNHQSLLDIPVAGLLSAPYVPRFVTRSRYHYGVPAVSPCLRLMGCPIVDPADRKAALRAMQDAARTLEHGMLIFPEGHRTRDGEIGEFKTAGVLTVLRERRLPVYLVVTDGFWWARRFVDFVFGVSKIQGETVVLGPFEPPADREELPAFVDMLRNTMIERLAQMRRSHAAA